MTNSYNSSYRVGRLSSFKQWQQIGAQFHRTEKETPVVLSKAMPRRCGSGSVETISGPFEGADAEATQSSTYLLAKSSFIFNGPLVVGDTPLQRPEPPGLAVRLESAERFVAAKGR